MKRIIVPLIVLVLTACGGGGGSGNTTPPANQAPTANAGTDKSVNEGMQGELVGAGADSDGTVTSFSWQQESGTAVTITDSDMASASFTAPAVAATESLVFRLTITDNNGAIASDTVAFTVIDTSAKWDAYIASLDTRINSEQMKLASDQEVERGNAGSTYLKPEYLVRARNRFISHVDDFFEFSYTEIILLANDGISFPRGDFVIALTDYKNKWQIYLEDFLASSFFDGHVAKDLDRIIRVEVLSAVDFASTRTIDRVDAFVSGPWEELLVSLEYGFILETRALEAKKNKGPTSGSNLAAARNVFIGHVNSSFDYLYDETIRFTNDGNLFSRDDVIALLNTYGEIWQDYLDWYVENGPFSGAYGGSDFDTIFIPDVLTAIEAAIDNTLSRLDTAGRLF